MRIDTRCAPCLPGFVGLDSAFRSRRATEFPEGWTGRQFTDRDWEMMQETTRTALDNAPDGETVSWSNSDSGASGTIRPLETYDMDGMRCRRTELSNSAGDYPATANSGLLPRQMASGKSPHPKQTPAAN